MNEREYYSKKINKMKINSKYKEKLNIDMKNIKKKFPVILNSYHFSNIIGYNWKLYKDILRKPNKHYSKYYLRKKTGKYRTINVPSNELKYLQKEIKGLILDKIETHQSVHGFKRERSIKTNAQIHLKSKEILSLDLKDFFPSIKFGRIYHIFNKVCGYSKKISFDFTRLLTLNNELPQGSPASPVLSNIVCFMLDIRLVEFCKVSGLIYTRYADDITISSDHIFNKKLVLNSIKRIIIDEGFELNTSKTRFQSSKNKLEVTGLHITDGNIKIPRKYIKKIKQEIYYINRFGLDSHIEQMEIQNRNYLEHLYGKIKFVIYIESSIGKELLTSLENVLASERNNTDETNQNAKKQKPKNIIKKTLVFIGKIFS